MTDEPKSSTPQIDAQISPGGSKLALKLSPLLATWLAYDVIWHAQEIHTWWVQAALFLSSPSIEGAPTFSPDWWNLLAAVVTLVIALITRAALEGVGIMGEFLNESVRTWLGRVDRLRLSMKSKEDSLRAETGRALDGQRAVESGLRNINEETANLTKELAEAKASSADVLQKLREEYLSMGSAQRELEELELKIDATNANWITLYNALKHELDWYGALFGDVRLKRAREAVRVALNRRQTEAPSNSDPDALNRGWREAQEKQEEIVANQASLRHANASALQYSQEHEDYAKNLVKKREIPKELMDLTYPISSRLGSLMHALGTEWREHEMEMNGTAAIRLLPPRLPSPNSSTSSTTDSEGPGGGVSS